MHDQHRTPHCAHTEPIACIKRSITCRGLNSAYGSPRWHYRHPSGLFASLVSRTTALIDQLTARDGWADLVIGQCAELMATSSSGEEKAFEHAGSHRNESP